MHHLHGHGDEHLRAQDVRVCPAGGVRAGRPPAGLHPDRPLKVRVHLHHAERPGNAPPGGWLRGHPAPHPRVPVAQELHRLGRLALCALGRHRPQQRRDGRRPVGVRDDGRGPGPGPVLGGAGAFRRAAGRGEPAGRGSDYPGARHRERVGGAPRHGSLPVGRVLRRGRRGGERAQGRARRGGGGERPAAGRGAQAAGGGEQGEQPQRRGPRRARDGARAQALARRARARGRGGAHCAGLHERHRGPRAADRRPAERGPRGRGRAAGGTGKGQPRHGGDAGGAGGQPLLPEGHDEIATHAVPTGTGRGRGWHLVTTPARIGDRLRLRAPLHALSVLGVGACAGARVAGLRGKLALGNPVRAASGAGPKGSLRARWLERRTSV
mmetsp:Transcript_3854/g.12895  ORF Transcript_3854/g.12895 Transcript_3854/m.12895 type:complete len:382 (-) Transcript_3854:64-1209(-)